MSDEPREPTVKRKSEASGGFEVEISEALILLVVAIVCGTAIAIVYLVVTSGGA